MAAIHTECLRRACAELNPGESHVYDFLDPKVAHNEYCYFRTALRALIQTSSTAKLLTVNRSERSIIISMAVPDVIYPSPRKISSTDAVIVEKSIVDLSPELSNMKARILSDLSDGIISKEEAEAAIADLTCNCENPEME